MPRGAQLAKYYQNAEFERIRLERDAELADKERHWTLYFVKEMYRLTFAYQGASATPQTFARIKGDRDRLWDLAHREQCENSLEHALKLTRERFILSIFF